jgi:hypothetical protein
LQEYEKKMVPWLYCFAVFTLFRLFAFVFGSIVNDMIFGYNIVMCILWIIYTVANVYGWLLVYSLYLELSDLTKLEDLAHLRVSRLLIYSIGFWCHLCEHPLYIPDVTVTLTPVFILLLNLERSENYKNTILIELEGNA